MNRHHQAVDNHEKRLNWFVVETGPVCGPGNQIFETIPDTQNLPNSIELQKKKKEKVKFQHLSGLFQQFR